MLKKLRCRLVLLASLLALCVALSCVSREDSFKGRVSEQPDLQRLISPELLEHTKLKVEWETKLPIKETERLDRLFILGNRIYALSDHNYVVSLNRENGNVVFSRSFAPVGLTMLGLGFMRMSSYL